MQKASFCNSSFCVLRFDRALRFPLKLQQPLGGVSGDTKTGRGTEKRPIKINTVALHSFTVKQQLHKTGDKYYLCNRGKRPATRGPINLQRPANLHSVEKRTLPWRESLKAILDDLVSTVFCSQRARQNGFFILIYNLNSQPE